MKMNLADKLLDKIDEKRNSCIVGLDPFVERIPKHLFKGDSFQDAADALRHFNFAILDAVSDLVPCTKLQVACYEKHGAPGLQAFKDSVDYAHEKGLIVIEDGKRADIGSTSQDYADGHLGTVKILSSEKYSLDLDLLTVNPYLGSDGLLPFVDVCKNHGKGIFILTKTSNPSAGELQDRLINITPDEERELNGLGVETLAGKTQIYNLVALRVNRYANEQIGQRSYSQIGAVVGATYPDEAKVLRRIMPNSIFLVPGYGTQGAEAKDLVNSFNEDGYGAVVNSSRGIIFAYEKYGTPQTFAIAAREATISMIKDINSALKAAGKLPKNWK